MSWSPGVPWARRLQSGWTSWQVGGGLSNRSTQNLSQVRSWSIELELCLHDFHQAQPCPQWRSPSSPPHPTPGQVQLHHFLNHHYQVQFHLISWPLFFRLLDFWVSKCNYYSQHHHYHQNCHRHQHLYAIIIQGGQCQQTPYTPRGCGNNHPQEIRQDGGLPSLRFRKIFSVKFAIYDTPVADEKSWRVPAHPCQRLDPPQSETVAHCFRLIHNFIKRSTPGCPTPLGTSQQFAEALHVLQPLTHLMVLTSTEKMLMLLVVVLMV